MRVDGYLSRLDDWIEFSVGGGRTTDIPISDFDLHDES
jgi:hypothetical protein